MLSDKSLKEKLKEDLNPQQFEVATHIDGPAVVMAGAGSGKTHTLISRVSYLIDQGAIPESILMLTFTNAAADEMKSRAVKALDERCGRIVACTYHSFCNLMLRKYGSKIGLGNYTILSYVETKNMIDYVKSSHQEYNDLKGFPPSGVLASLISLSINKEVSIKTILERDDRYDKYRDYWKEITTLATQVRDYGFKEGKLTYDDLLVYMNQMLARVDVCKHIAGSFKYIMVDEFQDTNSLQENMLIYLGEYNKNIVVVGDISQSIYAFRGADVKNIMEFSDVFEGCKVMPLTYNYRSTKEILDAANAVMRGTLATSRQKFGDKSPAWDYYDMKSPSKTGDLPIQMVTSTNNTEASDVFETIRHYHEDEGIPYNDIAVLARSSFSTFELENMLNQEAIEYVKYGGTKFMDLDAVGDMLALIGVIVNPHDLLAWFRVLQLHPGIGKKFAKKIADGCSEDNFLIDNAFVGHKFYKELQSLEQNYHTWRQGMRFDDLFGLLESYYFDTRSRACEASRMSEDSKEEERMSIANDTKVVKQLRNIAAKYDSPVTFMDNIVLDADSPEEETEDSLVLSTIHSAKGLEWKVVIIMDCVDTVFPRIKDEELMFTEPDMEELRCFYVAMTRAEDHLIIMTPEKMISYNGAIEVYPSHYLEGTDGLIRVIRGTNVLWDMT